MLLSVIVPVYNKSMYLEATLRSVLNQKYDHWEMLIVDDGSTDSSLEIARNFEGEKVRVFSQENSGVGVARNNGARMAKGKYLCFLDADDEWHPDHLTHLASLIEDFPSAGIWSCRFAEQHIDGSVHHPFLALPLDFRGIVPDFFEEIARSRSLIQTSSCCLDRASFEAAGEYPVGETSGEDVYLWLRMACENAVAFDARITSTYKLGVDGSLGRSNDNRHPYPLAYYLRDHNIKGSSPALRRLIVQLAVIHCVAAAKRQRKNLCWDMARWLWPYDKAAAMRCMLIAATPSIAIAAIWSFRNRLRALGATPRQAQAQVQAEKD